MSKKVQSSRTSRALQARPISKSHQKPETAPHVTHTPLACSSPCRIASLHHKSLDKPMKDGSIVVAIHTQLNEIANLKKPNLTSETKTLHNAIHIPQQPTCKTLIPHFRRKFLCKHHIRQKSTPKLPSPHTEKPSLKIHGTYSFRSLLRPELDVERPRARVQHHLPLGGRLQHIHRRHR